MKNLSVFAAMLLLTFFATAQGTWRPGTLTLTDGTELTGEIDDREWDVNPDKITFRSGGEEKTYLCAQVRQFTTDRPAKYSMKAIRYDGERQDFTGENLPFGRMPEKFTEDTVFLRIVVDAPIGLAQFMDSNRRSHYFLLTEAKTEELISRKYKVAGESTRIGVNTTYRQQLAAVSTSCSQIQAALTQLSYNESALEKMVLKINECHGAEVNQEINTKTIKRQSAFGVNVQGFVAAEKFDDWFSSPMGSLNFGAGVSYESFSKKRPGRQSIYSEIGYKSINQSGDTYSFKGMSYECSVIRALHSFRLSTQGKKAGRWFLGTGLNYGVRLNTLIDDDTSIGLYSGFDAPEMLFGFNFGIGKSFAAGKKTQINLESRYEYNMGLGPTDYIGRYNSSQLGLFLGISRLK